MQDPGQGGTPQPGPPGPPLEESLAHYKELINAIGCIVWEGDPRSYAFTFVSDQAENLLGYPTDRWLETPSFWIAHIHPDDRERVLAFCSSETLQGRSHEVEYRMIAADGREVWLKDIVTLIREDGRVPWSQGIMVDITDRKRLELELTRQNAQLRELDVLKSELLNTAAHELRTPLTAIRGFSEFLDDEIAGPLTPDQREFVAQIQQGAARLQGVLDKVLEISRWEAEGLPLTRRETDLTAVARRVADALAPQVKQADVTLDVQTQSGPTVALADAGRLEQALLNLVDNALKFTPPGGRVVVSVSPESDAVRVEVSDTGIGLAPEHHGRVFDKFFQADPSSTRERGGTGLGLAIARAVVEAHGGAIGVESEPERGATFWFTLPRDGQSRP